MTQYYDDTAKDYAERAEAAAESASQSRQQATTAAATAATQANIATNAAQNAATLVKSDLENDVRAMKDAALSAASQASANAAAASASAVDASHDAIDADQARQAAQAAQTAAETAQTAAETAMGNAASSAGAAAISAQAAATSASNASGSASNAATSESNAATSESNAEASAQAAATSEENAENSAKLSQSWAVGGTGVRQDEDTDNAKHYAELAEHFSPVSKADKVTGGDTDGMVAGLDSEGNLTNSGIPVENTAQKDGYYEDMTVGRAENLIDVNATPTPAEFGFRTTAGDISIDEHGVAVIDVIKGGTEVPNQLVSPTNLNKVSGNGSLEVTDAAGGEPKALELRGAALVRNQLVQNGDFGDGTNSWSLSNCTGTVDGNVLAITSTHDDLCSLTTAIYNLESAHVYMMYVEALPSITCQLSLSAYYGSAYYLATANRDVTASVWNAVAVKATASGSRASVVFRLIYRSVAAGDTCALRNIQVVDLTQLFNGDTAKINAIQTWEDLVAVMPEYGQYVAYNTGEVVGSDAGWEVRGKNLLNPVVAFGGRTGYTVQTDGSVTCPSQDTVAWSTLTGYETMLAAGTYVMSTSQAMSLEVGAVDGRIAYGDSPLTFTLAQQTSVSFKIKGGKTVSVQLEYGSVATAYVPYVAPQAIAPTAPLFAAGTVYDSEYVVAGKRTQRIGSYTFTGQETVALSNWRPYDGTYACGFSTSILTDAPLLAQSSKNCVCDKLDSLPYGNVYYGAEGIAVSGDRLYSFFVRVPTTIATDDSSIVAWLGANHVTVKYIIATPGVTDITPTPVTLQAGINTFTQTSGDIRQAPMALDYDGTRWSIPANSASKYIVRTDGEDAYVTGVTSIAVDAARNKVVDLTRWFGKGYEPATLAAFYALYPLWRGADIPYMPGSIANFQGTAVVSRFFNAYNHETGTAELLGGNQYQICGTYTSVSYETIRGEAETLDIDADGIFTPAEDGVLTVVGGNDTDTCVHLTWSGYRNYGTDGYRFEKYGQSVRELPVAEYFPQGMNGFAGECDELHADKAMQRYGMVDLSTLSWKFTTSFNGGYWDASIAGIRVVASNNTVASWIMLSMYNIVAYSTIDGSDSKIGLAGLGVNTVLRVNTGSKTEPPTGYLVYELATPIVTPIEPPLNLSYTADDFGTEELLPRNTLENIATTRMDALIRYNLDFTRLGVHVSEIWNYLEDLAKNNADYARAFGYYKQMTVGLAENLIDIHATGEDRTFQLDTSCGETSISDDGSASVQVVKGSTVMWNQIFASWKAENEYGMVVTGDVTTFTARSNSYGTSWNGVAGSAICTNHVYMMCMDLFFHDVAWIPSSIMYGGSSDISGNMRDPYPVRQWCRRWYRRKYGTTGTGMLMYLFGNHDPALAGCRLSVRNTQIFDLTLMFGFGREPQTYEEFLRRFPDPAYPAEASRTVSFNGEAIATVGFNQCDPGATHIRVLPQAYQITGPGTLNFHDTELPSDPVAVTYGAAVEPFGFYKNGTKWYRALLGIADYDSTKTYRVNDGVVHSSQWYKCNTQIDAAEEFDASKWDAVTLEDALADNFLFTPLFIEPDTNGIFTPPTRGWLYYEGVTAETCIHFTWSGYRNGEHEDYWREERELPVKQYFPDGMRGEEVNSGVPIQDELLPDKAINRFGTYTFTGNETWTQFTANLGAASYKVWYFNYPSAIKTTMQSSYAGIMVDGFARLDTYQKVYATTGSNMSCGGYATNSVYVRNDACDTLEKIQAFMAGRKLYYPLATPIVTPIDPPLNLTYKVADFGTEQLVPFADSTMPSTPFMGTVRYSTDFTRELVHIVDEHVRERVDEMEATIVQKADKDGVYQQMTVGNSYNMIDRHAEGVDRQIGYDTSCGTASISDDGSAEIQELRGSTIQLQNLVADEYQNVYQVGDGYVELPYAYGGEVQPVLYGRTYVPNQQVPDEGEQQDIPLWDDHYYYTNIGGVEDIVTGLSTITVTPGTDKVTDLTQMFFPGHEPSTVEEMRRLYPTAGTGAYNPGEVVGVKHSVWTTPVFNQQVQNGDFSDGTTGWFLHYVNGYVSDNELTVTYQAGQPARYASTGTGTKSIGDKCLCTCEARTTAPADTIRAFFWDNAFREIYQNTSNVNSSEWTRYSRILTAGKTGGSIYWLGAYDGEDADNQTAQIRNVQFVNLTQLFGAGHEPATVEAALTSLAAIGKDMTEYHAYDPTGTPVGGTVDMSDSDVELHGFVWVNQTVVYSIIGTGDKFDPACGNLVRNTVKYTFTGTETTWTTVTDASYPNGRYYRFDTNTPGQIVAEGNNSYPYLVCNNPAFHVSKQGGANQREHSMSVSATRYLIVCSSLTLDEIKDELAGTTVVYRRNGSSQSSLAYAGTMPTTLPGTGYLRQVDGLIPVSTMFALYDAVEYDMRLVYGKYYWFRHDGEDSILRYTNRDTFLHVVAGQDQLAQLECLIGSTTANAMSYVESLFTLYPYLKTLTRLPYGGPLVNFKGTGIKTVGFNLLNITAEQGDLTGWATTSVPRKFEEGKFYVGFKADNTINTAYAQFVSTSASQVNFKSRSYYGLLYPMRCFPNTQYQFTGTRSATNNIKNRMVFYDINGAWISAIEYNANANDSALFTTPENAYWMCLLLATSDTNLNTTRYEANPCVHLTWSGYRNGDYETYWEETRDLPVAGRFPDGMNGMETVWDTIKSAGTVQNYNVYTFTGDETVNWWGYGVVPGFSVAFPSMLSGTPAFRLEGTHKAESTSYYYGAAACPQIAINGTTLYIQVPGVRTVAQMKEWLKGRKLVYRRATPDPIPYDEPVNLTYKVADFGTEQMVPGNPTDAFPTTTALNAIIRYNSDMARTITKLPQDYISKESLADLNSQLGTAIGGVITATWDASEQKYVYTYTRTPTVVTLAAGTGANTLAIGMSYIHAPTVDATYTLPTPTDLTQDNTIIVDVTCSNHTITFKQGTTTLAPQRPIAPATGVKYRFICTYSFSAWKVFALEVT